MISTEHYVRKFNKLRSLLTDFECIPKLLLYGRVTSGFCQEKLYTTNYIFCFKTPL